MAPVSVLVVTGTPGKWRPRTFWIARKRSVSTALWFGVRKTVGGTISTLGSSITVRISARKACGSSPGSSRTSSSASAVPGITLVLYPARRMVIEMVLRRRADTSRSS